MLGSFKSDLIYVDLAGWLILTESLNDYSLARKRCEGSPGSRGRVGEVIVVHKVGTAAVGLVDQRQNLIGGAIGIAFHSDRASEHHSNSKNDPRLNEMF